MQPSHATASPSGTNAPWRGLLFVALGVSLIMLDTTVVNVALPWMAFDLGFNTSDTQWVVAGYSLSFAAFLISAGRVADIVGRRRVFVMGVLLFVLSSTWIGFSHATVLVIIGRFVQGAGAAMIMPSSLSMINANFTGRDRATAFAVWGGTIGGMAALGPLVGGWVTDAFTWNWAFFINIPVAVIILAGVTRTMPESRDDTAERAFDVPGMVLSGLGLAGIVFALIEGQRLGWIIGIADFAMGPLRWQKGGLSISLLAALEGTLCLIAFAILERARSRSGKPVLIDFSLFRIASFRNGNIVAVIVSLGEFGLLYVLPLFVQGTLGYSPMQSGVLLLALAIGSFLASAAGARLTPRVGAVRVLQVGMLLEAISIVWIGLVVHIDNTRLDLAPGLIVYGLGIGFATAQLTGVILRDVPLERSGQASAIQSTARQGGAAIGTAVLGATLAVVASGDMTQRSLDLGFTAAKARVYADFLTETAGQLIQFLVLQPKGKSLVEAAHQAFTGATRSVAWVAAVFVILGLAASLRLPSDRPSHN